MIPNFHAIWGVRRSDEPRRLSRHARAILKVLRNEWEMGSSDLRKESRVKARSAFTRALDELQAAMIVIPSEVLYQPTFTYIWTLAVGRFPDALRRRISPGYRVAGNCARLSSRSGYDAARRAGPRNRSQSTGRGPRQSRARRRGIRHHFRAGCVSTGHAGRAARRRCAARFRRNDLTRHGQAVRLVVQSLELALEKCAEIVEPTCVTRTTYRLAQSSLKPGCLQQQFSVASD